MTPDETAKWYTIGQAAIARGDVQQAEDAIGRAVLNEPSTASATSARWAGVHGPAEDGAALLEDAKRLLADGRDDDAEASFRRLLSFDRYRAEGNYGIGYLRLRRGQADVAELLFNRAIAEDPQHANAAHQLGYMAEQRGEVEEARNWYAQSLAGNPAHKGSQSRLAALSPPVGTEEPVTSPQPDFSTGLRYGVYESLLADDSPLSRETIASMNALHTNTLPRFTAYVGRHIAKFVLLLAAPLVLFNLVLTSDVPDRLAEQLGSDIAVDAIDRVRGLQVVVVWATIAVLAVCYARVKTTRFTIGRGRLQIHKGILARRVSNIELWRVQSVELDRTLANRITGDGTLMVELAGTATANLRRRKRRSSPAGEVVKVTGLSRGKELDDTFQQLLNLVFLLRANPIVKGIIQ